MSIADFKIVTASDVDPVLLDKFLRTYFGSSKCDFLKEYGDWYHRGQENRLVAIVDEDIAGYCAVIPTTVQIDGLKKNALWWIDLYVDPKYRNIGIQHEFDLVVSSMAELKLGVPNELAMKVHRKHGWGVRDDYKMMLMPLIPQRVLQVVNSRGVKGFLMKVGAWILSPLFLIKRIILKGRSKLDGEDVFYPRISDLLLSSGSPESHTVSTFHDEKHVKWRFLDSPFFDQYRFYKVGENAKDALIIITRTFKRQKTNVTRILDVYGNLHNRKGFSSLLTSIISDAIRLGSSQITSLVTIPEFEQIYRKAGFILSTKARFCWLCDDQDLMNKIENGTCHWNLADSDNDTIV